MQSNLECSQPQVSSKGQSIDQRLISSVGTEPLLEVTEPGDTHPSIFTMNDGERLEKTHYEQRSHDQKQRLRWRPSPVFWRCILIIGDNLVMLVLLLLIINPAPHVGSYVPGSVFGMWNAYVAWLFLVLASWAMAVNILQAQQLDCAASVIKSPLTTLCALILTIFFCFFLLYLFTGDGVLFMIKPLVFFLAVSAIMLSIWRISLAEAMNLPRFRRQAVIVGDNAAGRSIARELLSARRPSVNVLGFIHESINEQKQLDGLPVFGGRSALYTLTQNGIIDMVIMAIEYKANPELFQEALAGSQRGISVVPVAAVYESTSGKIPLEQIGDQWSLAFSTEQSASPLYACWRKVIDLTFCFFGLLIFCLLLPVLALMIRLDSHGPIFFSQVRAGYHGRHFRILKFRSMHTEVERVKDGLWVSKGDARVTRVGRLLRMTHLDELPQVLNIVRGDMSFIGPRPERPDYIIELSKSNPFYSSRLSVKPGLTGWAQVKYGYGGSEHDELIKLQYDLYYIKHQSFLLDVLILLKTVGEVMLCHGI